jgi:C-terminal processing protease CtpA/Prc
MAKRIGLVMLLWVNCLTLFAQNGAPKYVAGANVVGSKSPCLFVGGVWAKSPAVNAGIQPGDRIISVDGTTVTTVQDAAQHMHSESAKPVRLQLSRDGKPYILTLQLELYATILEKNGMKLLRSGMIVPLDATEAEMDHKTLALQKERFSDRVFPLHYPEDESLYFAGFEMFVLKNPPQIAVGGIEDGPASRAGVHWGDFITSVNGSDPRNKSVVELEWLFTSQKPVPMTLSIDRDGVAKTFSFQLEKAAEVMSDNQLQLFKGILIPLGVPAALAADCW